MADIYRLSLTAAGLIDVQANSAKEALELAQTAIKAGGLKLAGRPLLNVSAALNPVVRIDNKPLTQVEPTVMVAQNVKTADHSLQVDDIILDQKTTLVN